MAHRPVCSLFVGLMLAAALQARAQTPDPAAAPPGAQSATPPRPAAPTLTGGAVDAARHFSIGGFRVLAADSALANLFGGVDAGTFTIGEANTFLGGSAGRVNTSGYWNTYVGAHAGEFQTGSQNTLFGYRAAVGTAPANGGSNTVIGSEAATGLSSGSQNVYVGATAGSYAGGGSANTAVGYNAGGSAVPQNNSGTFLGANARLGTGPWGNVTAIGANAEVNQENSLVLGSINGFNGAGADTKVGIGITAPAEKLHVNGGNIRFANSLLTADQGGSIELGGTNSIGGTGTPYIDFHYNGGPTDFSVRLINNPITTLTLTGNLNVTGVVSKSAGSFRIDHPLDPENKYLSHSFVESPDMKNIYDGVVTLDEHGTAVVELPDWFEALNRDFRYQLTCLGGFAPVYIDEEVSHNRFSIAGGTPGIKVSWQVTGIRHDAFAEAHRIQVEELKPLNTSVPRQ